MARTILYKLLLLTLVIIGVNFIYEASLYKKDLASKSKELVDIKNSQDSTDIYYFGESSNVTYKEGEPLINSISEFTSWFYPTLRLTNINKYATHAGIYRSWLKAFDKSKKLPAAIVVTMNLRSFNQGWINSDLETQLQESVVFANPLPPLVNRFLLSLRAFDNKTPQEREIETRDNWQNEKLIFPFPFKYRTVSEWDQAMANGSYLKPDGSWDMDKIILACHYVKGYAFNIKETNPRIKDFDKIADWCSDHGVTLYLNLMAENTSYADSLVGKELVFLMKQNRDFLVKRYHKNSCKVVDNLEAVKGKDFIDQNWTTEHYALAGRKTIARNLADTMKSQFKNHYKIAY